MRKHIYLSIKQRLKSILGTDEEPIIKHFDLWNQQTDFLEQETPFNTPAVFIEFGEANWHQLGNRISDADLTVRLHIITRDFMQTADYSPLEMDALSYLDLIDIICSKMQGFAPAHCNRMMRTRSIPNHNHERYVDSIEEYTCRMTWKPLEYPGQNIPVTANAEILVNPPQTPDTSDSSEP